MDNQTAIELILDHYENPRNAGTIENPTFTGEATNPGCGDVVRIYARLDDNDIIRAMTFEGRGCTISQAAASLLTEVAHDKPLDELLLMDENDLAVMLGQQVVRQRLPCVALALRALQKGGQKYRNQV